MYNESDSPANKILNVVYSVLWCFIIWLFLPPGTSEYFLLIPFFWFIHARAQRGRIEDLRDKVDLNNELLIEMLKRDPNFDMNDFIENYEDEK